MSEASPKVLSVDELAARAVSSVVATGEFVAELVMRARANEPARRPGCSCAVPPLIAPRDVDMVSPRAFMRFKNAIMELLDARGDAFDADPNAAANLEQWMLAALFPKPKARARPWYEAAQIDPAAMAKGKGS